MIELFSKVMRNNILNRRDTYANMVCSLANIRFEIISILYNIGSMHTQLGARTERTSTDGMKMACAHFQCAAWAFEHLKNSYPQPSGVDLAPELMTFMHQLCLAQGQECILEKSMLDNRKPTIVGKYQKIGNCAYILNFCGFNCLLLCIILQDICIMQQKSQGK